ncbi:MAG: hypothetical protein KatS3mg004_2140 [Bryobacteraceae bacterium]|nr:MAG: hypothetical protein KatS3mg004_2140 [Bryobacteraceae bacterium]
MSERNAFRFSRLPFALRLALSCFLATPGIGYLVEGVNLYLTYHLTDGEPGLSVADLRRAFYGQRDNTRLAGKIDGGSMVQFLPRPGDRATGKRSSPGFRTAPARRATVPR